MKKFGDNIFKKRNHIPIEMERVKFKVNEIFQKKKKITT